MALDHSATNVDGNTLACSAHWFILKERGGPKERAPLAHPKLPSPFLKGTPDFLNSETCPYVGRPWAHEQFKGCIQEASHGLLLCTEVA